MPPDKKLRDAEVAALAMWIADGAADPRTDKEIAAWTKLPAKPLFSHPSQNGDVGLVWVSLISGKITVNGRLRDAHPGGPDGLGWVLEHFAADV